MSDARQRMFSDVVLPHLDAAFSFARGLTGNSDDARDVVQDACLRALKGINTYAGGNARAWLLTITRNAAFAWLARNRPKSIVLLGDDERMESAVDAFADPAVSPEASLIAQADRAALDNALAALPPPFREIIILREYNNLSYREIAEMTRVPIGTVMSRLARARALMLKALAPSQLGKAAT